jgi:hypothetical protein
MVQSQPGQINSLKTLSEKYPIQKSAGGVAQVVEILPSKCEARSSKPSAAKTKENTSDFQAAVK